MPQYWWIKIWSRAAVSMSHKRIPCGKIWLRTTLFSGVECFVIWLTTNRCLSAQFEVTCMMYAFLQTVNFKGIRSGTHKSWKEDWVPGAGRTGFACKLNKLQFIASQSEGASKQRAKTKYHASTMVCCKTSVVTKGWLHLLRIKWWKYSTQDSLQGKGTQR